MPMPMPDPRFGMPYTGDSGYGEPPYPATRRGSSAQFTQDKPSPNSPRRNGSTPKTAHSASNRHTKVRGDSAYSSGSDSGGPNLARVTELNDLTEDFAHMSTGPGIGTQARRGSTASVNRPTHAHRAHTRQRDTQSGSSEVNDDTSLGHDTDSHLVKWKVPSLYLGGVPGSAQQEELVPFKIPKEYDYLTCAQSHWNTISQKIENQLNALCVTKTGSELAGEALVDALNRIDDAHNYWWRTRIDEPRKARDMNSLADSDDQYPSGMRVFEYDKTKKGDWKSDKTQRLTYREIRHPREKSQDSVLSRIGDETCTTIQLQYDKTDHPALKEPETVVVPLIKGWHQSDDEILQSRLSTVLSLDFKRNYSKDPDQKIIEQATKQGIKTMRAKFAKRSGNHATSSAKSGNGSGNAHRSKK
ncbi:uncharacterized protein I303_107602 [Kwoniella dejecticola CBS 10117]|uniref:Uncharacterized protein n=1 Tax=Kwoniella dejecticola CBS 10117 TaxID=1296121 RepID=A0A1A5ZV71_9TREE|nr:uncharacterized protein I303_07613 [Kwoniella dejecticola CBS 10117]OBR81703.1 hypothetical protein I303_07613 [Kwoniella dejecticola CBS 10117]